MSLKENDALAEHLHDLLEELIVSGECDLAQTIMKEVLDRTGIDLSDLQPKLDQCRLKSPSAPTEASS